MERELGVKIFPIPVVFISSGKIEHFPENHRFCAVCQVIFYFFFMQSILDCVIIVSNR